MKIPNNAVPDDFSLVAIYFLINPSAAHLGDLSEMGELEVEASSQHAFAADGGAMDPGVRFVAAFHGELPQARDTVLVALKAINHPGIDVLHRGAFDIGPLMSSGLDPISRGRDILRIGMTAMLGGYHDKTAGDATVPTFLIGYPAPFITYAADNAGSLGKIGPADIVVYYVSRGPKGAHYFHAAHWPCPLNE